MKHGVLPTKNLPEKSHSTKQVKARRQIFKHDIAKHDSFDDHKTAATAKLPDFWFIHPSRSSKEVTIHLTKPSEDYTVDEFRFIITAPLSFVVYFFGIPLSSRCTSQIDLANGSLLQALKVLDNLKLCAGYQRVLSPDKWIAVTLFKAVSTLPEAYTSNKYVTNSANFTF